MDNARVVMAEQCTGRGARGVVAAAAPLAAALGAEALRGGGNAFDAATTAALAETVLLPPKCGLAGDLVALCLTAGEPAPRSLLAIGGAARRLGAAVAEHSLPSVGGLAVGVPGAPGGYAELAARGRLSLQRLVEPARRLAEDGFVWAPICASLASESADLVRRESPYPTAYYPDGKPVPAGAVIRLPGLARVLVEFANRGADLFTGSMGEMVVETVKARGGVLELEDFSNARAEWIPAVVGSMEERTVWATPAPTHGAALVACVESARVSDGPLQMWRRLRAAIASRDASLADHGAASTSMVSASDADGNVVVVIHSNSFPHFGSGLVVRDLDLILSNRAGRGFTPTPGHPNFPSPGKRPATTLHAWAVGHCATPELLGGTPGGVNQLPWNAQLLAGITQGCVDPGMLVTAPRWAWVPEQGALVEADYPPGGLNDLRSCFDDVQIRPRWGLRSAQQIIAVPKPGAPCVAAVDPRTGGAVVAG